MSDSCLRKLKWTVVWVWFLLRNSWGRDKGWLINCFGGDCCCFGISLPLRHCWGRWYICECFQRTTCGLHGSNPMWVLHMSNRPIGVWRSPQQKEPGGVPEKGVVIDPLEETWILPGKGTAGGNGRVVSTEEPAKASPPDRGVTLITYWDHGEGGQVMIS